MSCWIFCRPGSEDLRCRLRRSPVGSARQRQPPAKRWRQEKVLRVPTFLLKCKPRLRVKKGGPLLLIPYRILPDI